MIFGPGVPWFGLVQEEMRQKRTGQAVEAAEAKAHRTEDVRAARERHARDRITLAGRLRVFVVTRVEYIRRGLAQ
jgi:hypothetical protein